MNDEDGAQPWQPPYWQQHIENIKAMRSSGDAPVDKMGAETCFDSAADPKTKRLQVLLSLMLSSQTKDQVTSAAMNKLIQYGCTLEKLQQTSLETIQELIYPVGFWKRKADYIMRTVNILQSDFGGDIPNSVEGLCSLPGVGPKMAHLTMLIAWKQCTGIAVDTHVHRVSNRLGWTQKPTSDPEQTRIALEAWMPKSEWSTFNKTLVGFGQQVCTPKKPKCTACLNKSICPYALKNS